MEPIFVENQKTCAVGQGRHGHPPLKKRHSLNAVVFETVPLLTSTTQRVAINTTVLYSNVHDKYSIE